MTTSVRLTSLSAHAVCFYEDDVEMQDAIVAHVVDGLRQQEAVVVVATPEHRGALEATLGRLGADLVILRRSGRYVAVDAMELLSRFLVNGSADATLFAEHVCAVLDRAATGGRRLRVFGEMVGLLWRDGNVAAAVQLESLWNELARARSFSLLCGYPTEHLEAAGLARLRQVCERHSRVIAPGSYRAAGPGHRGLGATQRTETFLPVPEAVPAVRRFVARVLRSWGVQHLVADANLVCSELATNAVTHAGSPFQVRLERSGTSVLVAVTDAGAGTARRQLADPAAVGGRGLAIVEAVADRWDCDTFADGKVVWALFDVGSFDVGSFDVGSAGADSPGLSA
ncbi:MEDS domain-containing protein [Pedococcus sp. 5OH_020]|uniref:MEDS domain-containing protein n=1 Tax=Pedococcus sp. 5OH_020 TaxID=2989814 RepID=UPI0022E9E43B|nr:MEDS domain-containing protein [Pedococcus sp. 5OH_020]